jgi:ATP-dependent DNA ligase
MQAITRVKKTGNRGLRPGPHPPVSHLSVRNSALTNNEVRKELVVELTPLRADALEDHPWRDWAVAQQEASAKGRRLPGATSRWNRGKDLSWEPLRPERVCEVAYDHMQGARFRHAAKFLRWREGCGRNAQ